MSDSAQLLKQLDERRRDLGISYELLSKRCGVSRPTVQRILSGRHAGGEFREYRGDRRIPGPEAAFRLMVECPRSETGAGGAEGEEARRPGPGDLRARRPGGR